MSTEPKLGTSCPRCEGTGVYNFGKCSLCDGHGRLDDAGEPYGKRREVESAPAQPLTIHSEQPGHFVTTVGPMIRERGMPSRAIGREDADDKSAERQQPSKLHNEGSSPSSPSTSCTKCGKPKFGPWSTICSADIGKVNEYYCQCVEVFEAVPPAAETAMTAEQFDENWLRSRHLFVTGCNKGALVTLDDALAYAAHVREAAQGEIASILKDDYRDYSRLVALVEMYDDAMGKDRDFAKSFAVGMRTIEQRAEAAESKLAELEKVLRSWPSEYDSQDRMVMRFTRKEWNKLLASLRAESKEG